MHSEDILQRCLEELATGRQTPQECAAQFAHVPGLASELAAAQALMSWPPPTMDTAAVSRHQARLRAVVAAQARPRRPGFFALPRWAAAAALVLVVLLSGAGTLSAAAHSLPGQALYPVKRTVEAVLGAFTPASRLAAWHASQAETRTAELQALAELGTDDAAWLDSLVAEIGTETEAALASVPQAPEDEQAELLERILAQIERQQAVLAAVHARAPQAALAGLQRAMMVSRTQREAALARLSAIKSRPRGRPTSAADDTHVPPGQARQTATLEATALPPGQARRTATAEASQLPPGQANKTATAAIVTEATALPPGQANKTATAAAEAASDVTPTPEGASAEPEGQGSTGPANCNDRNPNAGNYCTPTPPAPDNTSSHSDMAPTEQPPGDPAPTACPLNPAGNPVCSGGKP